jgi:hypothetical protein
MLTPCQFSGEAAIKFAGPKTRTDPPRPLQHLQFRRTGSVMIMDDILGKTALLWYHHFIDYRISGPK